MSKNLDAGSGRIGPYRLLRRLATGGLGQVHLAESPGGRLVAIKVLHPAVADAPESRSALAREARAAARVNSPFTTRLIDADIDGPVPWLASEYISGPTLDQRVHRAGPLPVPPLVALAAGLAEGLGAIHAAGLVHRDLKPSNVILTDDGPRITDFGLATTFESASLTEPGVVVGTPTYMSPEQLAGREVGPASDVFSLGGVLTFAAAGTTPFHGGSFQEIAHRLLSAEPDLAGVPEVVRPLIAPCLAKEPAQRPTTTEVLAGAYAIAGRQLGLTAAGLRSLMGTIPKYRDTRLPPFEPEPELPIGAGASYPPGGPGDTHEDRWSEPGAVSGGGTGGHGRTGNGGSHGDDEEPRLRRFLTGIAPERAPAGARISLLVQVTLAATAGASAALKYFPVGPTGTVVTITVSAPGLIPLGNLEQDLAVPFAADSDPVRFGFLAGPVGLHSVQVRAFAGGTFLGDLSLEISVETGATLEEGRPRTAPLPDLAAEPGEVTLQVGRTAGGGYSFQLLSGALYPAVLIDRLAREPGEVIGQMIAELRAMSKSTAQYATPALARRRLRSLGSQLWGDVVPQSIREQFWAQHDRIRLFTIASDMDTVPWELLYPVDLDNDDGFLVEQFPVVRRVYGQDRARALRLDRGAGFIVPPKPPANALDEVAAVRAAFPAGVLDRGTEIGLAAVLELLDAGAVPSVLHFAGHNTFTDETGSLISLDGGPLRPSDLSYARQRHAFESTRPLVFLNGCRTAGEIPAFTQMIGWASEFMGAGAGAFIGTLWAVRSAAARAFAAEFYRALVRDGESLGVASSRARQAIAADEGDPTWLAYTVYGNPAASVIHTC
jgi:Protein kinase domain/CHAT domain